MKTWFPVFLALIFCASVCDAKFIETVDKVSGTLRESTYQVFWFFSSETPNVEKSMLAFSGMCDQFSENEVLGVVVLDDLKYADLLDESRVTVVTEHDYLVDTGTEGIAIYSPGTKEFLFQGSSMMSVGIVLQVLDRLLDTTHGSKVSMEKLFEAITEGASDDCAELYINKSSEKTNLCEVLEGTSKVIVLPPGCTECSLKKFRAAIEDVVFASSSRPERTFLVTFSDPEPAVALELVGPENVFVFPLIASADIEFLGSMSVTSRLRPLLYTIDKNGDLLLATLEASR